MDDLITHQEAPHTWSWTGRFAQFLPLQVHFKVANQPCRCNAQLPWCISRQHRLQHS